MTPEAFGQQLRRLREKRRISLDQVAQSTKVSATFLRALESGDCGRWPGGIYGRGFVRAYAAAIGFDPEQAVALFAECYPAFAVPPPPETVEPAEEPPQTPMDRLKSAVAAWLRVTADTRR